MASGVRSRREFFSERHYPTIDLLMDQNEIKVQVNNLTPGERTPLLLLLASIVGFPLPSH